LLGRFCCCRFCCCPHPPSPPPSQTRTPNTTPPTPGPVDIISTLSNGVLVDPTDQRAVSDALLKLLTDPGLWEQYAVAGRENIHAYSWPSHCIKCLNAIETSKVGFH
jgi:glycosyltransferase involved in cell wall biosynthesis